ncbi:hypothetical protein HOD61_00935 [archaeon]|jgi:tellurite resistance protein TehA-like permease|nr:hypothetical protein [archaeon]
MNWEKFNPLIFLMALGAGGISVIPFAFFQYTTENVKGLITMSQMGHGSLSLIKELLFRSLEFAMAVFAIIHIVLMISLFRRFNKWKKTDAYKDMLNDPLKNTALLAPFIAIIMTLNVFIGPVRFFIQSFADNLQSFMLPALIAWGIVWIALMKFDIKLLKIAFEKDFDIGKISFGWLLHPFALSMLTVTGTGIAALAKNASIAHAAAFMSMISGTMAAFLLTVKLISIFKSHYAAKGLPERQFLPSFLIVIPNITLLAISAFRIGHYLEHNFAMQMGPYYLLVMTLAFAFETWYMLFGLSLLKDYFTKYFFKKEFYVSQWGLVCPVVAYAVLGSFVYKVFVPSVLLYLTILGTTLVAILLFIILFIRQGRCSGILSKNGIDCLS